MINPHIINLIAKIYSNDSTMVTLGELEEEMEVNSGIKQGCTASTTLFKIITYKIMSSIEEKGDEYEVDNQKISTLFFADDSLAMAKNLESAKKNLKIITEASKYYGLEINKDKSSILVYNNQENITEIEGIKVVDKFKYLGLTVDNKKDIFKTQKQDMLDKLNRAASRTYSVIKRSCNKMLVGKTYWKGVILPSALHGIGLIDPTKKEISKLQTAENKTYRTILGARRGTATAAIRGETGASLMSSRFMKAKIMLARSIWRGKNKLVKEVLKKMRRDRGNKWNKKLNHYLELLGINFEQMVEMSVGQIKRKINNYDSGLWYEDMQTKRSLSIYRKYKKEIKDEKIYDNTIPSELLFRARSNTLALNIEKRHRGESTRCELCYRGEEDLQHFMLECRELEEKRDQNLMMKHWSPDKEEMIGNMIFDLEETDKIKAMLMRMWHKRKTEIKNKNIQRQQIRENLEQRRPSRTSDRGNSSKSKGEAKGNSETNGGARSRLNDVPSGELIGEINRKLKKLVLPMQRQ